MKFVLSLLVSVYSLFALSIQLPSAHYEARGGVNDIVLNDHKLYVATSSGEVDVFDVKTKKMLEQIKVKKIPDFMGDLVDSKVYSVDVLHGKVLLLSQAKQGYTRVHIYDGKQMKEIISFEDYLSIAKAKFLNDNTLLLALLSGDIISYDMKKHKQNWLSQSSGAKFSDFALDEKKEKIVIADESGDLHIYNTKDGTLLKTLSGKNLDNVFQVDYKNSIIATAGQDRRMVIYNTKTHNTYYKSSKFIIYSVGLSPSGKIVAYSSDENNNITLLNTSTKAMIGIYGGNTMTLTHILFIDEKKFFASNNGKIINFYNIK